MGKALLPGISTADRLELVLDLREVVFDIDENALYIGDGSTSGGIPVAAGLLSLGETSDDAYRGDRGKTAYDHSQVTSGNPHSVTKSEVGLSNVDNTSDVNKPISTSQQAALDDKVDIVAGKDLSENDYVDADKAKVDFISVTQAVDLDDIETRVNNLDASVVLKGTWDASAGTFPGGGTAQAGASYIVSIEGTVDSVEFKVGDRIIAITDNASTGTFASNWFKADYTDEVLSVNGQTGAVTLTTANVADSANKRYVTDAQLTVIGNTSGTNSGDAATPAETVNTIGALINGAGAATPNDADLVGTSDTSVLKKITWTNVKAFLKTYFDTLYAATLGADDNYVTDAEKTKLSNLSGTNSGDNAVNSNYSGLEASKQDALTNGYGLTGTTTKAITISSASAFATAETTISAATYADIAGCSISLVAGTWLVYGHVIARAANGIIQVFAAITHSDNTVISESAISRPASGTASLNSPISCSWFAIVSPGSTTTYKLRGARGLTTHTGSWIAMDGNGVNTANHVSNNTDKGTGIFAIRLS